MLVQDGVQRMRWREGVFAATPSLMTPGTMYQVTVTVGHMSYIFNKGHRIKVGSSTIIAAWLRSRIFDVAVLCGLLFLYVVCVYEQYECYYHYSMRSTHSLSLSSSPAQVAISSSNHPRFSVNPNTGDPMNSTRPGVVAHNTVTSNAANPSALMLPVMDEGVFRSLLL